MKPQASCSCVSLCPEMERAWATSTTSSSSRTDAGVGVVKLTGKRNVLDRSSWICQNMTEVVGTSSTLLISGLAPNRTRTGGNKHTVIKKYQVL